MSSAETGIVPLKPGDTFAVGDNVWVQAETAEWLDGLIGDHVINGTIKEKTSADPATYRVEWKTKSQPAPEDSQSFVIADGDTWTLEYSYGRSVQAKEKADLAKFEQSI